MFPNPSKMQTDGNKIADIIVNAPTDSILIAGLNSLKDGSYVLVSSVIQEGTTPSDFYAWINAEKTSYTGQLFSSTAATIGTSNTGVNSCYLGVSGGLHGLVNPSVAHINIHGGHVDVVAQAIRASATPTNYIFMSRKTNKIDKVTSILIQANARVFGNGSRFQLFKMGSAIPSNPLANKSFMGNPVSQKLNSLLMREVRLLGEASSIVFKELDGNRDGHYVIAGTIVAAGAMNIAMRPNGIATAADYPTALWQEFGTNKTVTVQSATDIAQAGNTIIPSQSILIDILIAKGLVSVFCNYTYNYSTQFLLGQTFQRKLTAVENLTHLELTASGAGFQAGTVLALYKRG